MTVINVTVLLVIMKTLNFDKSSEKMTWETLSNDLKILIHNTISQPVTFYRGQTNSCKMCKIVSPTLQYVRTVENLKLGV